MEPENPFSLLENEFRILDSATWELGSQIGVSADILAGAIALLSLAIAVFTYVSTSRTDRRHARRQHTIDILKIINEDGPVMTGQLEIAQWNREKRVFTGDDVAQDEDAHIISALDYYDFVSAMALQNALDVEVIATLLGGRMKDTKDRLMPYIEARRKRLERPQLYQPYADFVETHLRHRNL